MEDARYNPYQMKVIQNALHQERPLLIHREVHRQTRHEAIKGRAGVRSSFNTTNNVISIRITRFSSCAI